MKSVAFVETYLAPKSIDEDIRRREWILNVLLASAVFLFTLAHAVSIFAAFDHHESYAQNALPLLILGGVLAFFIFLYFLSRKGFIRTASFLFLAPLFLLAAYMGYRWGVDVPAAIVFYPIVVVMAGILISTRFAFLVTALISATVLITGYLQQSGALRMNQYWKNEIWSQTDLVMIVFIYFIIATVSWLSNREIEKSLMRARKSEAELKVERDSLEVNVEERTRELKEAQAIQISQLYRLAEFGKLSAGLFHDLMNPLTALSLNIESIQKREQAGAGAVTEGADLVAQAVRSARKLEALVASVRRQMTREKKSESFIPQDETNDALAMLTHVADTANVSIETSCNSGATLINDPAKFHQIVLNLVTNAIDASRGARVPVVRVSLEEDNNDLVFHVSNIGPGIPPDVQARMFEPFYTTKENEGGMGLGLAITKRLVEDDFGGTLTFTSEMNTGSTFTARLPLHTIPS